MKTQNQALLNRIKAFTLVELIVVITILAILGTIAFISFQGYSRSARNSKRISDIANIKTTLALFNTKTGRYPEPDSPTNVTYNTNMTIRTQGVAGEQVTRQLEKLGKTPLDPLLETEYAYSVLNTKKEYEVGCIFEGEVTALNSKKIINQTLAEEQRYYAYIKGDYNGKIAKASSGAITYIFAVPSIISSNLGNPDLQEQINNKLFVFNGYQNIPDNYKGRNITMTGGFDFGGYNPLILTYSDNIKDLSGSGGFIKDLGDGLKSIYSGSILANNSNYKEIVELDTSDTIKLNQIIGPIINNNLGGEVKILAGTNTIGGTTTSKYPGCDTDDISVGKYKVAACNVGSTISGTGTESYGRLFQWGEMYGWDSDGGTSSTDNVKYVDGVEVSGDSLNSWSDIVSDTEDGGANRWLGDNSPATQGPCAPGYHIPTNTEWSEIISELGSNATTFTNTLKIPYVGARVDLGSFFGQGGLGVLYSSSPSGTNSYIYVVDSSNIGENEIPRHYASSVRCVNNDNNNNWCATKPSYSHTTFTVGNPTMSNIPWQNTSSNNACYYSCIDGYSGNDCSLPPTCATQPSYTHTTFITGNPIVNNTTWQNTSSSNPCYYECIDGYSGNDCITPPLPPTQISECDYKGQMGEALTYYSGCNKADIVLCSGIQAGYIISSCNIGTTISGTGTESYGKYFQWGNNYGFSESFSTTGILVDATGYGPGNYYNGNVFIHGNLNYGYDWTTVHNNNLWGETTNTNEARQGPCENGYHIPSRSEWDGILYAGGWSWPNGYIASNDLKLPYNGGIDRNGNISGQGTYGNYWSTSVHTNGYVSYQFYVSQDNISSNGIIERSVGFSIRCLKN